MQGFSIARLTSYTEIKLVENAQLFQVLEDCRSGQKEGYKKLYEAYAKYVYNLTLRYTQNEDDAKDATQETFIQVFKSIQKYNQEKGRFKSWLSKIAINKALRIIEKRTGSIVLFEAEIDESSHHGNEIETEHSIQEIMFVIERMPTPYKMVFDLFVIEGFNHEEISEILNISVGNSRVQLNRGRQWLISKLPRKGEKHIA